MRIGRIASTLAVVGALWLAMGVCSASAAAVIKEIKVAGSSPQGVSSDRTHVWVAGAGKGVDEIDATTGKVVRTIRVGGAGPGVSSDGTHVWVTNGRSAVSEINASTGRVVRAIRVGLVPQGVSSDGTHVWVTNPGSATVSEIDASTGAVVKTILINEGVYDVSSDGTHAWVTNGGGPCFFSGLSRPATGTGCVVEIDALTGAVVKRIPVGGALDVSSDGTHVWVTRAGGAVGEIDASIGTVVRTIKVRHALDVSSDRTHVWVTNQTEGYGYKPGMVTEIDAWTGTVVNRIPIKDPRCACADPQYVSSDGTHVWVTNLGPFAPHTTTILDGTVIEIKISKP